MTEATQLIEAFDARARRRDDRRAFFKSAAAVAAGATAFAFSSVADAANPAVPTDADVLNFALNLEYLEANFYYYAVFGTPIPATSITGVGTAVPADTAANAAGVRYNAGARAVTFTDPLVAQYAREIAADELAHVNFLRANTPGAVAQPTLDVGITPTGAFSSAARAAGLIGASTTANPTFFDPYSSDENFLLGAFIFEDVGVTAYKGASPLITNKTYLEAAAGILAVEAYHASIVRAVLYRKGIGTPATGTTAAVAAQPTLITATTAISDARDSLDGTSDLDQGIASSTTNFGTASNIVPTDANAIAYSRSAASVLNIVYLTKAQVTAGGFFPNGVNGNIATSAAN